MEGKIKFSIPKLNSEAEFGSSDTIYENTEYLKDGRPIVTHVWSEDDYTFITYYIPTQGLEEFSQNQLLNYLIQQGVKIPHDINEMRVSTMKYYDTLGMECWSITIVVWGSK
jgi:hypothetical protein